MPVNDKICVQGPPGQTSTNQYLQLYTNNQIIDPGVITPINFDTIITRNGSDIIMSPFPGTTVTLTEVHSYYISYTIIIEVLNGLNASADAILYVNGVPERGSESSSNDNNVITVSSSLIVTAQSLTQVQLNLEAFGNFRLESAILTVFEIA